MNDRFKFRTPILEDDGKFLAFHCSNALEGVDNYRDVGPWIKGKLEQCAGLKDKNGKLIYEGDIVKRISKHDEEEPTVLLQVEWNNKGGRYVTTDKKHGTWTFSMFDYFYEVVGNIHENPELLEDK